MTNINENPTGNKAGPESLQYVISLIMQDCMHFGVRYPVGVLRTTSSRDDYYFEYSDKLGYTLTFWERGSVNWGMNSLDADGFRFLFQQHIILHNFQSIPDSVAFMQKAAPVFGRTEEYKEALSQLKRELGTEGIQLDDYLFIIPVAYEGEPEYQENPDHELHFGEREAVMYDEHPSLSCSDLPEAFVPAAAVRSRIMHYQTLQEPDGERYIPLFTSYEALKSVFGDKTRIGVICYETAREFVLKEGLDGIVVSPVTRDTVIPARDLQPRKVDQPKENAEDKQQEAPQQKTPEKKDSQLKPSQLNKVCITKEYFADIPSVMEWVTRFNSLANDHLVTIRRFQDKVIRKK